MKEVWKFYKETNSRPWGHRIYEVSNFGRVKLNGELYTCPVTRGYYYLLHNPLHRIVAQLFLPDWDPNKEVDHINGNKLNNIATGEKTNLRMCSHKENMNNPLWLERNGETHKGLTPWNKGIPHTEETRQKLKLARQKYLERKNAQT